jgi:hypothetical protein
LATQLRALMTAWIRNTANRGPSVPPLDLALVTSSLSPVVNSSDNYQHSGGTPTSPLFSPEEAPNAHQGANTAGSAPSRNLEGTICWSYIIVASMIVVTPSSRSPAHGGLVVQHSVLYSHPGPQRRHPAPATPNHLVDRTSVRLLPNFHSYLHIWIHHWL